MDHGKCPMRLFENSRINRNTDQHNISIFHDFSMTFDIFLLFQNFSRPGNQFFKFHDFSRFSMTVRTLMNETLRLISDSISRCGRSGNCGQSEAGSSPSGIHSAFHLKSLVQLVCYIQKDYIIHHAYSSALPNDEQWSAHCISATRAHTQQTALILHHHLSAVPERSAADPK